MNLLGVLEKKLVLWLPKKNHVKTRDFLLKTIFYLRYPEMREKRESNRRSLILLCFFVALFLFYLSPLNSLPIRRIWGYKIDSVVFNDSINDELLRASIIEIFENKNIEVAHKEIARKKIEAIPISHLRFMYEQSSEKNIPPEIYFPLVYMESRFDSLAVSPKGASGYCQIMPGTFDFYAKKIGLKGGNWWKNNIIVSTEFLSEMNEVYQGKW